MHLRVGSYCIVDFSRRVSQSGGRIQEFYLLPFAKLELFAP